MFGITKGQLEGVVSGLVRVGRVSSVDASSVRARVTFPDRDDVVSADLPIIVAGARRVMGYWMPEVDEQVLCIFLPFSQEDGFILGGFYSDAQPSPIADEGAHVVAGDSVHLGDWDASDPVVRRSDLQAAIDDMKSYTDNAVNNHKHQYMGAGQGASLQETTLVNYSADSAPTAKASDKVFSS